MVWHLILAPITALLNLLYAALPPWTVSIGSGAGDGSGVDTASDHGFVHYSLLFLAPYDKWLPLHDGVLPLVGIAALMFTGLLAFKMIKFVLSLIPTINAGG